MEVRIGVVYSPKELVIDIDGTSAEVIAEIEAAAKSGTSLIWLTDSKGRKVAVPADKLAYVEIAEEGRQRVGFGIT
jgi:DNA-binding MurR/RpiR family transcriptional regulator